MKRKYYKTAILAPANNMMWRMVHSTQDYWKDYVVKEWLPDNGFNLSEPIVYIRRNYNRTYIFFQMIKKVKRVKMLGYKGKEAYK